MIFETGQGAGRQGRDCFRSPFFPFSLFSPCSLLPAPVDKDIKRELRAFTQL